MVIYIKMEREREYVSYRDELKTDVLLCSCLEMETDRGGEKEEQHYHQYYIYIRTDDVVLYGYIKMSTYQTVLYVVKSKKTQHNPAL
jgi:hypothetical protein